MNENVMVVLQIETKLAVERRDELLSVPGVDVVMVGPVDLSISLGVPGDFHHEKMVEAMDQIRESCLKHGVVPERRRGRSHSRNSGRNVACRLLAAAARRGFFSRRRPKSRLLSSRAEV
jgi:2-keto-3-deoxy-L-rhamnonate aldolase RhmA